MNATTKSTQSFTVSTKLARIARAIGVASKLATARIEAVTVTQQQHVTALVRKALLQAKRDNNVRGAVSKSFRRDVSAAIVEANGKMTDTEVSTLRVRIHRAYVAIGAVEVTANTSATKSEPLTRVTELTRTMQKVAASFARKGIIVRFYTK